MKYSLIFILIVLVACSSTDDDNEQLNDNNSALYFPPINSNEWEITDPSSLGWNISLLNDLNTYLVSNETRAFIILKNGKIVNERY